MKWQLIAVSSISALFGLVGCKGLIDENKETCFCETTKPSLQGQILWIYSGRGSYLNNDNLHSAELLHLMVQGENLLFYYFIVHHNCLDEEGEAIRSSSFAGTWYEDNGVVYLYVDSGQCIRLEHLDNKKLVRRAYEDFDPPEVELALSMTDGYLESGSFNSIKQ